MDFSAIENGLNSDIIRSSRKDWTLAHDVALLKHLENFSLRLISKTDAAVRSLEEFESDINSVCLHIKAISHKCQSLADKQFIEHRVQEDDVTTYVEKKGTPVIEKSGTSKSDLSSALISCLTALHSKYEKIHLQGVGSSDNNSSQVVITPVSRYDERFLPPFLGTEEFYSYYSQKSSGDSNEKMSKLNTVSQISDKISIQDSSSVSSSNFTFDEDDDSLLRGNKNPSIHSMSCEHSTNIPFQSNDENSISNTDTTNQEVKPLSSSEDIIGHLTMAHVRRRRIQMEKEKNSAHKDMLPSVLSGSLNEEESTFEDLSNTTGTSESITIRSNHTIPPYDPFYAIRPTNTQKPQTIFDDSSDSDDLFTSDNHVPFSQKIFSDEMTNNDNSELFTTTDSFTQKVVDHTKPGKSDKSEPPLSDNSHLGSPEVRKESNLVSNKLGNNFICNALAASAPLNQKLLSSNTTASTSPHVNDTTDNSHKHLFSTLLPPSSEYKEFSLFPDSGSSSDEDDLFCPVKESRKTLLEVTPPSLLPKRERSKSPDLLDLLLPKRKGIDSLYKSFPAPLDDINTFYTDKPLYSSKKGGKLSTTPEHLNVNDYSLPSEKTSAYIATSYQNSEKHLIPSSKVPIKPKSALQSSNSNRNSETTRVINDCPTINTSSVNIDKQKPGKLPSERYLNINPNSLMGNNTNTTKLQKEKYEKIKDEIDESPILSNNEILPSFKTEILTNVVKSRAKIVSKRRLPSRKHLKDLSSNEVNNSSKDLKVFHSQNHHVPVPLNEPSVLSPSTDEEDLFTVPPSLPPREISCSNLFSDSSLLSPGTSVDSQNINDFENNVTEPLHKSPLKIIEHYNISKEEMSQILKNPPILNESNLLFESSNNYVEPKNVSENITTHNTFKNSDTLNQRPVDKSAVINSQSPALFGNSSSAKNNLCPPSYDKPSTSIDYRLPTKPKSILPSVFHNTNKDKKPKTNVDSFSHKSEQNTFINNIDSEDDEDYLFSDIQPSRSKFHKSTKNNANEKNSSIDGFIPNPELFTDLFGDSDGDDDLFNVKKTPLFQVPNNNNNIVVNPCINPENNFNKLSSAATEDSFGKSKSSLTKPTDFTDPLGIHLNHQTD